MKLLFDQNLSFKLCTLRALSKEQFPWSERQDFASEFLD
jgi:hypothetical protein